MGRKKRTSLAQQCNELLKQAQWLLRLKQGRHILARILALRKHLLRGLAVGTVATAAALAPAQATGPFVSDLQTAGRHAKPALVDIDGDGDRDAFVGGSEGVISFFRNLGGPSTPTFAPANTGDPFAGIDVGSNAAPAFVDSDGDGDQDAVVGEGDGTIIFFRNTGSATNPSLAIQSGAGNPFDGVDVGGEAVPTLVDIDGDGDPDAFVGADDGTIRFFRNTGSATAPTFVLATGAGTLFESVDVGSDSAPTFVDIDDDSDPDAFVGEGGGSIRFFRNTGSAAAPRFVEQISSTNPLGVNMGRYPTPTFVDIDGDSDPDAFVGGNGGTVRLFRNSGTITTPLFVVAPPINPFGDVTAGSDSAPALVDIDGDGDLDAFVGGIDGTLRLYRNTGSATAPVLTLQIGSNPLAAVDVGSNSAPVFVNIDNDGDEDVFVGAQDGMVRFFRNTGTATVPAFVAEGDTTPFGLGDVGTRAKPALVDIDNDGDQDVFVGEEGNNINFFRNTGTSAAPAFTAQTEADNPFASVGVVSNSAPAFVNIDGDGDQDVIIGSGYGTLRFFRNTGSAASPTFAEETGAANPFNGFDTGNDSTPTFGDIDNDGDRDTVVGETLGMLSFLRNNDGVGTQTFTDQSATNPFNLSGGSGGNDRIAPAFADLDGNNTLDAILGLDDGTLRFYRNTGTPNAPAFTLLTGAASPFIRIDVGYSSTPALVDIDNDGDHDLFVGEANGTINFFRNTGTVNSPVFAEEYGAANPLNPYEVGSNIPRTPTFVDIDGDGDPDAFVGERDGVVSFFRNSGTANTPVFVRASAAFLGTLAAGGYSTLSFVDIDGDADFDAFGGAQNGSVQFLHNTGSATDPTFVAQSVNPLGGVDVGFYSAPTLVDIDGDGDADAFVGGGNGVLRFLTNNGSTTVPNLQPVQPINPIADVVVGSAAPSLVDIDNDGDRDLIIGNSSGTFTFFRNTGTATALTLAQQGGASNPLNGVDVGSDSTPAFVDIDNDGDQDLFVGYSVTRPSSFNSGRVRFYRNSGTAAAASFTEETEAANPLALVNVGYYATPTLVDIDGDGDPDAFVGSRDGTVRFYRNTGNASAPAFVAASGANNPLGTVAVGGFSAPTFVDLDSDGDRDAFVGSGDGRVTFLLNTGTAQSPTFAPQSGANNPLGGVDVGFFAKPAFVDIDGDTDADLFVGREADEVRFFLNAAVPTAPTNPQATPLSSTEITLTFTDTSISEAGFVIERAPAGSSDFVVVGTVGANVQTFTDTGLAPNSTYQYRIRAVNGNFVSPYSPIVNATTLQAPTATATSTSTPTGTAQPTATSGGDPPRRVYLPVVVR